MAKVSIISPIHNPGKYLRPLLDSLVNQTFQDIEIILIDDGSTDGSREVLAEYANKDSRINLILREQSPTEIFGEKYSVDIGRQVATGDYIMIVDHDDELSLGAIEILYQYTQNGTVDVVQGRSITINEKGQQVYATPALYPEPTIVYSINTLSDEQLLKHLLSTPIALWTCLIRREFQKDIELGDYIYNDTDFIWKLKLLAQSFVYAPEYIYRQNEHADSVSGSAHTSTNAFYIFRSMINLERFLKQQSVPYKIWILFALFKFRMIYGHSTGIKSEPAHTNFIEMLKMELKRDGDFSEEIKNLFTNNYYEAYKQLIDEDIYYRN